MWESRGSCGISKGGGKGGNLGLAFHAFHGPAFPQPTSLPRFFLLSSVVREFAGSDMTRFRSRGCVLGQ